MSKKLIYVAMWEQELEELITFLTEKEYSPVEIAHLELVLNKVRYHEDI